jgi:soluble lytic murein transglycosylase-like protein
VVVAAIVVGVLLARNGGSGSSSTSEATVASYNKLPGVRKTKAPWPPEYQFLADRLLPLGLTTLPQEAVNTHYHSHLDIFADGKKIKVPALIGINVGAQYLTQLHTHDTRGVSSSGTRRSSAGAHAARAGAPLRRRRDRPSPSGCATRSAR